MELDFYVNEEMRKGKKKFAWRRVCEPEVRR